MGKKGLPPTKREPAEKKALSYAKDRRNNYGDNDKGARKIIPRREAEESRDSRRKTSQILALVPRMDEEVADVAESSVRQDVFRTGGWKKVPDTSLGKHVEDRLAKKASRQEP
jgi:hypothetical protein